MIPVLTSPGMGRFCFESPDSVPWLRDCGIRSPRKNATDTVLLTTQPRHSPLLLVLVHMPLAISRLPRGRQAEARGWVATNQD